MPARGGVRAGAPPYSKEERAAMRLETILVPVDFSHHSDRALDLAIELARDLGAKKIRLLHVHHPPPIPAPLPGSGPTHVTVEQRVLEDASRALEKCVARVEKASIAAEAVVLTGTPAETICEQAAEHAADLIAMGTCGRTGLAHVLLGSVAERTVAHAPCPVLTVRGNEAQDAD